MRLYGMYYLCKEYIKLIEEMKIEGRKEGNHTIRFISDWKRKSVILNEIAELSPMRERARKMYEVIPRVYRDSDKFDITDGDAQRFIAARTELVVAIDTVIELYETINDKQEKQISGGFDIKLPEFKDIGEFSKCLEDLNFVINQCPYLRNGDCYIKYGAMDVGSTWITFLLLGSAATVLLTNLSKVVDAAVRIKSHVATVKMQEEALRSIEIKNELATEVMNTFKEVNNVITDQCIIELQREIGELNDPEEIDKTRRSLEKLALWMDKGMQIYSAIDAPAEIKDLFPTQVEATYLTDDIQKLIEMKKEE